MGVSQDVRQRLIEHNSGRCQYTSRLRPWQLIYYETFEKLDSAFKRERQIKGWSRAKKSALIGADLKALKLLAKRRKR